MSNSKGKDWIVMPESFSGLGWDMYIDPARINLGNELVRISKELGLNLENTATDILGRDYIGNISGESAIRLNLLLGNRTMTLREGEEVSKFISKGSKGKVQIKTLGDKTLGRAYLTGLHLDMHGKRMGEDRKSVV